MVERAHAWRATVLENIIWLIDSPSSPHAWHLLSTFIPRRSRDKPVGKASLKTFQRKHLSLEEIITFQTWFISSFIYGSISAFLLTSVIFWDVANKYEKLYRESSTPVDFPRPKIISLSNMLVCHHPFNISWNKHFLKCLSVLSSWILVDEWGSQNIDIIWVILYPQCSHSLNIIVNPFVNSYSCLSTIPHLMLETLE